MKRLLCITMLFVGVALAFNTQAQGVADVQNDSGVKTFNPFHMDMTFESAINTADLAETKVVTFTYELTPDADSIVVITANPIVANVLRNTYNLKRESVTNKHFTFTFGNRLTEARVVTNILSVTTDNFVLHRVRC